MNAPRNQLLIGDAAATVAQLPERSVNMVLTSPPYFRLRDYGSPEQLGLETHVDQWVDSLELVLRGVKRVLKPSGSLWLNLGDSFSTGVRQGAVRKSLLLGPERVAQRLVADGWLLRNKIVWAKPNPMPSSVRDRLACSWEYLYLFASSARYHFDLDAIRLPHLTNPGTARGAAARRAQEVWRGPNAARTAGLRALQGEGRVGHPDGKNPGDVWKIANRGVPGAHHATFPVELARRAILAGCPPGGLVLDPFMGSGTTAVAAEAIGRDWLGIELNPQFAAGATERIGNARASPAA